MSESPGYSANLQRGILLREQGRYQQAKEYIKNAIAADPNAAPPYYQLAFCECDLGESKKALKTLERAISLAPHEEDYFALQGWVFENMGNHKKALEASENALALNPFCIFALNTQARVYFNKWNYKKAEQITRNILEISPLHSYALNILASSLHMQGRHKESLEVIQLLLQSYPNQEESHARAGWTALDLGDHLRAYDHFLCALQKNPNSENLKIGLKRAISSRIPIYRYTYRFKRMLFLGRRKVIIGTIVVSLIAINVILPTVMPEAQAEGIQTYFFGTIIGLYFMYAYLFLFVMAFGNLFLMFHPIGRHALTSNEKIIAILTIICLVVLLGAGYLSHFIIKQHYDSEGIFEGFGLFVLANFVWALCYVPIREWFLNHWNKFTAKSVS